MQSADFSDGVAQIVDMREWTFISPEISLYFFRPPEGDWILIHSRTRVGTAGAGLIMATLSDRRGWPRRPDPRHLSGSIDLARQSIPR